MLRHNSNIFKEQKMSVLKTKCRGNLLLIRLTHLLSQLKITAFQVTIRLEEWHFALPADGTLVPERVADAPLMFVLTETMYLVGAINGVL